MKISFSNRKTGLALLGIGFVFLAVVSFFFYDDAKFLRKAIRGYGTIISVSGYPTYDQHSRKLLSVRFVTEASEPVTVQVPDYDVGLSFSRYIWMLGQPVTFLCDPNNPKDIRPLTVSDQYPWSEILLVLASLIPIYFGFRILRKNSSGLLLGLER